MAAAAAAAAATPAIFPARPTPYRGARDLRRLVLRLDASAGVRGDTLEHIVPKTHLKRIAPKGANLHLDALNTVALPGRVNWERGSKPIGSRWLPPARLRGLYARAVLDVSNVGDRAADVVDDSVMRLDLAREWDEEYALTAWEVRRALALDGAQGGWALRELVDDDGPSARSRRLPGWAWVRRDRVEWPWSPIAERGLIAPWLNFARP